MKITINDKTYEVIKNEKDAIDEEVLNTYINALKKYYNNPSATHRFGMEGNNLLLSAKRQIAKYLSFTGCKEDEIIFVHKKERGMYRKKQEQIF